MFAKTALFLLVSLAFDSPRILPDVLLDHDNSDLEVKLRASVHEYKLEPETFVQALARVASDFQIPIGIEWVNDPAARVKARADLSWKNATVRQVLQAIIKTQPGYQMTVRNGIVHIASTQRIPDGENPLKVKIDSFAVHDVPVEFASRKLHAAAARAISPPNLQAVRGGVGGSGFSNPDDPKIGVKLSGSTIEDILDALALDSPRKIWIVTFSDDPTLTPAHFRRTSTLWNDFPIPDDDQPVWDLLHRGDAIPSAVLGKK